MVTLAHAYVDEARQRSVTTKSSDHFLLAAVIVRDQDMPKVAALLATLRADTGRQPGDELHWRNIKGHSQRLHVAQVIGAQAWLTLSAVVVCKRHLGPALPAEDHAYLYTVRLLLERLSWWARGSGHLLTYTLAHIIRFQLAKLRGYESILQAQPGCQVAWSALDPKGGRLDQPNRVEALQLADLAVSAIFAAYEPDPYGNTERRYLEALAPRLYRRGRGALTSYGLKMHPWTDTTRAAYPWVAAL